MRKWIAIAPQKPGRVDQNGGNIAMARDIVVGQEADNVAAYVASVAGLDAESAVSPIPKKSTSSAPPASTTPAPAGGTALEINAAADNSLAFDKTELTAPAGSVTIKMTNPAALPHNIAIKGNGITQVVSKTVDKDGVAEVSADLKPGTYEYFCEVPGHEGAGMKGTLTVTGDAGAAPVAAPVGGAQTVALPENAPATTKGPRIVGPWITLQIRDRRFSRLTAPVAARSFKIDKYVKPGFWIRIDPR